MAVKEEWSKGQSLTLYPVLFAVGAADDPLASLSGNVEPMPPGTSSAQHEQTHDVTEKYGGCKDLFVESLFKYAKNISNREHVPSRMRRDTEHGMLTPGESDRKVSSTTAPSSPMSGGGAPPEEGVSIDQRMDMREGLVKQCGFTGHTTAQRAQLFPHALGNGVSPYLRMVWLKVQRQRHIAFHFVRRVGKERPVQTDGVARVRRTITRVDSYLGVDLGPAHRVRRERHH